MSLSSYIFVESRTTIYSVAIFVVSLTFAFRQHTCVFVCTHTHIKTAIEQKQVKENIEPKM